MSHTSHLPNQEPCVYPILHITTSVFTASSSVAHNNAIVSSIGRPSFSTQPGLDGEKLGSSSPHVAILPWDKNCSSSHRVERAPQSLYHVPESPMLSVLPCSISCFHLHILNVARGLQTARRPLYSSHRNLVVLSGLSTALCSSAVHVPSRSAPQPYITTR
jgi:hypothetical protein